MYLKFQHDKLHTDAFNISGHTTITVKSLEQDMKQTLCRTLISHCPLTYRSGFNSNLVCSIEIDPVKWKTWLNEGIYIVNYKMNRW